MILPTTTIIARYAMHIGNGRLNMPEWRKYEGKDEQIAEMCNSVNGWICRFDDEIESNIHIGNPAANVYTDAVTEYLIVEPHPLADMIIRQAQTGQPVYWRSKTNPQFRGKCLGISEPWDHDEFSQTAFSLPDDYEYSFTPFED